MTLIDEHLQLVQSLGLTPAVIDVDTFALGNAFELNAMHSPRVEDEEKVLALIDVGSVKTNINIVKNGVPLYTQDLSLGGINFVDAVQKTFNLSQAEAEAAVRGDEQVEFDLPQVVRMTAEELAMGIERSILYLQTSGESQPLSRILLTGGGVRIPGLVEFLAERHQAPVEIANPLKRVQYDPALFGDRRPDAVAPSLTVGLGLALRKVDDR